MTSYRPPPAYPGASPYRAVPHVLPDPAPQTRDLSRILESARAAFAAESLRGGSQVPRMLRDAARMLEDRESTGEDARISDALYEAARLEDLAMVARISEATREAARLEVLRAHGGSLRARAQIDAARAAFIRARQDRAALAYIDQVKREGEITERRRATQAAMERARAERRNADAWQQSDHKGARKP